MNTNIALWREVSDEVFERHFRRRYFGDEAISRQQAIDRLVAMSAQDLHTGRVDNTGSQGTNGSIAAFNEPVELLGNARGSSIDIQIPMLPAGQPPWGSMLLSVLTHGLILLLLLSIQLPQKQKRNWIKDLDTTSITYYKISESFPTVAPKQETEEPNRTAKFKQGQAHFQAAQQVQIRPTARSLSETVIEQPNVPQVPALPKLQLPNILLQTSKMDPGREPLVVSPDVLRHLAMDVQQPQSLGNLPHDSAQNLKTAQPALPLPQLAAPAEPATEPLPVGQIGGQFARIQQRAAPLPFAAPPVDDSPAGFEIKQVPAQGQDLLVFSAGPAIPKGEIAVPKVSSIGRLSASSLEASQPVLPKGTEELSRTEVVIPSVSINNRTAPASIGIGTATVQAPLPKPPLPTPSSPTRVPSLLDFLPSRIPSTPRPATNTDIGSGESPLREYEGRGGPVYTAAINAPNFTSKRGSWIFRFAELSATEPAQLPGASLTAPSAIVKVDPKYAPEVVREKLEGVVILFAVLRKDGTVDAESVRVIRKLDSRLDLSAREALLNWRFRPSQRNGIAVDIQMEVSIPFYFRKDGL